MRGKTMSTEKTALFDFMNYREYLTAAISQKKEENSAFSMRAFAAKINCNPGFFNRIINGERSITPSLMVEISNVLKLTKKEFRYFETLVAYNDAKKQTERDYHFEQLMQFRKTSATQVSAGQHSLYSHWYYLVIRELLSVVPPLTGLEAYAKEIARRITPQVSYGEVRDALDALITCGIIHRSDDGALSVSDKFTASGTAIPQVIVNRFLLECTDLAKRAIDGIPKSERRLSTLTFSCSKAGFEKISSRIDEFRQEILTMISQDLAPLDRVCHLNLHLFPVSDPQKGAV